ncbi:MAG: ATP-binding protein [Coriobacteriia bacterium]
MTRSGAGRGPGRLRAAVLALGLVLVILGGFGYTATRLREANEARERERVTRQLSAHAGALHAAVNSRFALLAGLHEFVTVSLPEGPTQQEFDTFASGLGAGADGIRAIQVAPDGIVTFVHPLAGNVVGNNLLTDTRPEVADDIKRTLASATIVISGPYELRQGGLGLVGRQVLRSADGAFWGFAIMVLDVPPILEEAGIARQNNSVRLALRDDRDRVFAGDGAIFNESPVTLPIDLPDGRWELAAVPAEGWDRSSDDGLTLLWVTGTIVSLSLGLALHSALSYQHRLQDEVDEQTALVREQRDLFERVTETSPVGIAVISGEGAITFANSRAEDILGLKRGAIEDRSYDSPRWQIEAVDGGPVPSEDLPAARVLATGELVTDVRHAIVWPDGERKLLSINAGPLRAPDGSTAGVVATFVDITESEAVARALRESEQRLRTTMDCMIEGSHILDFDWRYIYVNDAAEKHDRRPKSEVLGRTYFEAWPGMEDAPLTAVIRSVLETRVPAHFDSDFTFSDGRIGWFDLSIQPVPEGVLILSVDITERRAALDELQRHKDDLERVVVERTRALADANTTLAEVNRELIEATQAKSEFLTSMSHELRTPLNSIIGFSDLMLAGLVGTLDDEQSRQIGMINASGKHLLGLINGVLDLAKVEAGQLVTESAPFNVAEAVSATVESLVPLAESKGLTLDWHVEPDTGTVVTDRRRLMQVLINLVGNAIKFTSAGTVLVRAMRDADQLVLSVVDTGRGIAPVDLPHIFEEFYQAPSPDASKTEGTGLGLSVSRGLVVVLGGTIGVESELGRGSTFTVRVPVTDR